MPVSRSRTIHLQSPPLTIGGTVLKRSDDLVIYWEWHLIPRWPLRSFSKYKMQYKIKCNDALSLWCSTCAVCASVGYTRCYGCYGRASVYICASWLQDLAVPQDLHSPLRGPVERSSWSCIRWCGTGVFQELGQCCFSGLSCCIPFCLLLFLPFSSFCL